MFKLNTNKKIGKYIGKLIEDSGFKSTRQFCRAYLETSGELVNDDELRKMSNRLSAIKKGAKSIQIKDLPVFTQLLDVSCEEILSAGEVRSFNENHMTNYQIAFSRDKKLWESYIHMDECLIFNPDEYNKTVIDYAIEFENYDFLRYLIDAGYIWFVSDNPKEYCFTFGAGTDIRRRNITNIDSFSYTLATDDKLRIKILCLAVERGDFEILEELQARELHAMYYLTEFCFQAYSFNKSYDAEYIEAISRSNHKILDYFSEEIEIEHPYRKSTSTLMFPFIGELTELLIKNKNKAAETILKRCIKHNQTAFDIISDFKKRTHIIGEDEYKYEYQTIDLYFIEDGNIISVYDRDAKEENKGMVTNIIKINVTSDDFVINDLINELNGIYNEILAFEPQKGETR